MEMKMDFLLPWSPESMLDTVLFHAQDTHLTNTTLSLQGIQVEYSKLHREGWPTRCQVEFPAYIQNQYSIYRGFNLDSNTDP